METDFCAKYKEAARKLHPEIKEMLSKDKIVEIDIKEIKSKIGKEFENKRPLTIYWGLKYGFYDTGIFAEAKKDDKIIFRKSEPGDKLPESLRRICKRDW